MNRHPFLLIFLIITALMLSLSSGYSQKKGTAKILLDKLRAELEEPTPVSIHEEVDREMNLYKNIDPPVIADQPVKQMSRSITSINNAPWRWSSSRRPKTATVESKSFAGLAKSKAPKVHKVKVGETMSQIAARYDLSETGLRTLNGINYGNPITGQVINVDREELYKLKLRIQYNSATESLPKNAEGVQYYTIKSGDNPTKIAQKFSVSAKELMGLNEITNPRLLRIGQKLQIPAKKLKPTPAFDPAGHNVHLIAEGESLWTIAQKYGVEYYSLIGLNSITNPTGLMIGQKLKIPNKE